jgi:hypothetical protein
MQNKSQSFLISLEIKAIDIADYPSDLTNFVVPISVTIGDKNDQRGGGETFHFIVASPLGLQHEYASDSGFRFLRGYLLMDVFDMNRVRRATENLINHAQALKNWHEIVSFFNRFGQYDSEDLDGKHTP